MARPGFSVPDEEREKRNNVSRKVKCFVARFEKLVHLKCLEHEVPFKNINSIHLPGFQNL